MLFYKDLSLYFFLIVVVVPRSYSQVYSEQSFIYKEPTVFDRQIGKPPIMISMCPSHLLNIHTQFCYVPLLRMQQILVIFFLSSVLWVFREIADSPTMIILVGCSLRHQTKMDLTLLPTQRFVLSENGLLQNYRISISSSQPIIGQSSTLARNKQQASCIHEQKTRQCMSLPRNAR